MALLLVARRSTPTNESLLTAARRLGLDAHLVPAREASTRACPGDVALARLDVAPTLDGVEDGIWELGAIEASGAQVLNPPGALLTAHDKLATAVQLARAGLSHPRTAQIDDSGSVPEIEFPVVVKPRFGSWGQDVILCRTPEELATAITRLSGRAWFRRQGALVQELVPPLGYDVRLVVANGTVVGAIERHAAPGEWRTNVALGARRVDTDPDPVACAIALAAAAAVGADLVGVDLLPVDEGWIVIELNGAVDFTSEYALDVEDVFETAVTALVASPQLAAATAA